MNQVTDLFQLTEFGFICFLKIPKNTKLVGQVSKGMIIQGVTQVNQLTYYAESTNFSSREIKPKADTKFTPPQPTASFNHALRNIILTFFSLVYDVIYYMFSKKCRHYLKM